MKPFSIADIRDVFRVELETYIATTREQLGLYLTPEGALSHLDSPAVHAHTMKGVAATVRAWGLAWLGEDLDALYELARSLHHSEPERARAIVGFIHEAVPDWRQMAHLSLEGQLDEALARYSQMRAGAERYWGGYLLPRDTPVPVEPVQKKPHEAEPVAASPVEGGEPTRFFQPGRLAAGMARAFPQPKLQIAATEQVASLASAGCVPSETPPSEVPKVEYDGGSLQSVLLKTGVAGAARRVAAPRLKVLPQEQSSEWESGIGECVSAPEELEPADATERTLEAKMPAIARNLVAPAFQVAVEEPSEWDAIQIELETAAQEPIETAPVIIAETPDEEVSAGFAGDELAEIFREEAKGYLDEITVALKRLRGNTGDEASWAELRRLCHTLKGSAATIGLNNVSEQGKVAEQLARAALEDATARTQIQLGAIAEAIGVIAGLLGLAWALESTPAFTLDRDLANAFCMDAFDQLDPLEAALLAWERDEEPEVNRRQAYRALHTLKGAANSIGLTTLGANLHLLEDLLEHSAGSADRARFGFFLETVDQLRRFATDLQHDPATEWMHSWDESVANLVSSVPAAITLPEVESTPANDPLPEPLQSESDDLEAELIKAFSLDARDQAAQCETAVLAWERGESPAAQITAINRAFHTLKGSANSVGLAKLGAECHAVESLIGGWVQRGDLAPTPALIAFLLCAVDQVAKFGALLELAPSADWPNDWQEEIAQLGLNSEPANLGEYADQQQTVEGQIEPEKLPEMVAAAMVEEPAPAAVDYIRVKSSSVHQLLNQVGELVVERNRFAAKLDRAIQLRQLLNDNRRHLLRLVENFQDSFEYSGTRRRGITGLAFAGADSAGGSGGTAAEFSELEMDRYDEFNMLSRALTEVADDLGQVTSEMESLIESFRVDEKRFATNSRLMQEDITGLTSQPIEGLFRRLERSFRDALQVAQKDAVLRFEGAHATLDRLIIERLHTPLLHLVRNAVSHGIESPGERQAAGKARQGKVTVSATQSSNQIIISVRDDGSGVSPERVLERARQRGLVAHDKTDLSTEEVLALLFTPGFSTAQEVTQVAGRGVGMDVVKREIEEMKGSVTAEWKVGEGTVWKIQLPLTLAVSEAIVVELAGQEFALPLNFTASGLLIEPARISAENGAEQYTLPDGNSLPLIRLSRVFGQPGKEEDLRGVILALGQSRAVLVVDRVLARREIVVKGLDPLFAGHSFLEGATLDSQGRPLLILSAPALLRIGMEGPASEKANPIGAGSALPTVTERSAKTRIIALVVDDSLSVRTVQNRLLSDLGCEVVLANDGMAALEKLRQQPADIIFTDLEMPRMNGYDLISAVRAHGQWKDIPMVLVTSRSAQKHLDKARQLGANACLTKPFTREDLAAMLAQYAGLAM